MDLGDSEAREETSEFSRMGCSAGLVLVCFRAGQGGDHAEPSAVDEADYRKRADVGVRETGFTADMGLGSGEWALPEYETE